MAPQDASLCDDQITPFKRVVMLSEQLDQVTDKLKSVVVR
jgi:hypothetical protein